MPPATRQTAGSRGGKSSADVESAKNLRFSFSNWIIGGDIVIPKSSGWAPTKTTSTVPRVRYCSSDESENQSENDSSDLSSGPDSREPNPKHAARKTRSKVKSVRWSDDDYDEDSSDSYDTPPKTTNKKPKKLKAKRKQIATGKKPADITSDDSQTTSTDGSSSDEGTSDSDGEVQPSSSWTPSQDALILSMREGGESWIDIGRAISCGAKEAEKRWEELAGRGAEQSEAKNEKTKGKKGKGGKTNGKGNAKTAKQPADTSSGPDTNNKTAGGDINQLYQREEVSAAILSGLYDDAFAKKIKPDDNFSPLDCRVLGLLSSKRKADRWLELQASFFNATGRMVPVELLRHKVEEAKGGRGNKG